MHKITCNEFTIVKIHAKATESLSIKNNSPKIQVPPSSGRSAIILISNILQYTGKHNVHNMLSIVVETMKV